MMLREQGRSTSHVKGRGVVGWECIMTGQERLDSVEGDPGTNLNMDEEGILCRGGHGNAKMLNKKTRS